ncbi:MFS transporter [Amycolatopsis jejuensis]|uniref:MFS transporter n=1 Tax=Amycolatopsis jejuensis TaxID=330084 RepID=UPI000525E1CD|nr:MFS transporter [Amycolatopsis jejuensis]
MAGDRVSSRPRLGRTIAAATIGNFVEWYEFAVYGMVAAYISASFFPAADPTAALLNTWAAYGTAFLVRPLGGLLLARIGDVRGRRSILYVSILMMSSATFLIALVPTHATIGIAAPILLVCLRLVQGLAAGGELAGAVAFLYEHAPANRRARTVSYLGTGTFLATLAGSALATLLTAVMPGEAMASWGWRLLFLIALPLGFVGIYIRRRVDETPEFKAIRAAAEEAVPRTTGLWTVLRENKRAVLIFVGFGALYSTAAYIGFTAYLAYMIANGMPRGTALAINTIIGIVLVGCIVLTGGLADRYGRRPVLITGASLLVVVTIPTFLLGGSGSFGLGLVGGLLYVIPFAVYGTPSYLSLVEMFPPSVRVTAGAAAYNSTIILGGFSPLISAWLAAVTGSSLAFPLYVVALSVVAVIVLVFWYREPDGESRMGSARDDLKNAQ